MSLYDDDYDPAYSHRITNIYYEDDPWNQKKVRNKTNNANNGNFVTNVFKLVGVLIVAFFIFSSMVK